MGPHIGGRRRTCAAALICGIGLGVSACGPADVTLWSPTIPGALYTPRCPDGRAPTYIYADTDGDGFGAGSPLRRGCVEGRGEVVVVGDCNDTEPHIHPGAPERCNLVDDDCDPYTVDEDHALTGGRPYSDLATAARRAGTGRVELCGGVFPLGGAVVPAGRELEIVGVHPERPSIIVGDTQRTLLQTRPRSVTLRDLELQSGLFSESDVILESVTLSGTVQQLFGGRHTWRKVRLAPGASVRFRGGEISVDGVSATGASALRLDGGSLRLAGVVLLGGSDGETILELGSAIRPSSIALESAFLDGVDLTVTGSIDWSAGEWRGRDARLVLYGDSTFEDVAWIPDEGGRLELDRFGDSAEVDGLVATDFDAIVVHGLPAPPSFVDSTLLATHIEVRGPGRVGFDDGVLGGQGLRGAPVQVRGASLELTRSEVIGEGAVGQGLIHLQPAAGTTRLRLEDTTFSPDRAGQPSVTGPDWSYFATPATSSGVVECDVSAGCGG